MRQLTIKRTKSFVGSLSKMKLYIEDANATDLIINGVACRYLGDLKNGEEKAFQIGEDAAKVFAIAGKMSKNYCNEFYQLPAGGEDLYLSGKNSYNPANGNAFRFDNNDNPEVLENRKKTTRRGTVVLAISLVVGFAFGYFFSSDWFASATAVPKVFTDSGMTITLTSEFTPNTAEGFTVCYDSSHVAVLALKEAFSLAPGFGDYTLEQYADLVLQSNNKTSAALKKSGDLLYFTYDHTNPETGDIFTYVTYMYKADDAFWLVQFVTAKEDAAAYADPIAQWADSVSF